MRNDSAESDCEIFVLPVQCEQCAHVSQQSYILCKPMYCMDSTLQQYLNAIVVLLSILVGAVVAGFVLPTTGEAVNTGSVLLWTALFAVVIGGGVFMAFLRNRPGRIDGTVPE